MLMRLLGRLCCTPLPTTIEFADEIDQCCVLHAAGLIEAKVPPVSYQRGRACYAGQATVMRVTADGFAASKRSNGS